MTGPPVVMSLSPRAKSWPLLSPHLLTLALPESEEPAFFLSYKAKCIPETDSPISSSRDNLREPCGCATGDPSYRISE